MFKAPESIDPGPRRGWPTLQRQALQPDRLGVLLALALALLGRPLEAQTPRDDGRMSSRPLTVAPAAKLTVRHVLTNSVQGLAWNLKDQQLYLAVVDDELDVSQVLRLGVTGPPALWLEHAQGLSGIVFGRRGHLLGAQISGHRIVKHSVGKRGPRSLEVILEEPTLNQPNDLCEAPNGDIYFTDPDFLRHARSAVYLMRPKGELLQLITEMPLPNGLALSLDATTLYVSDSHDRLWRSYPIMANGVTGPGSVFFNPPTEDRTPPNGMALDADGNLYLTGRGGVWVVNSAGEPLGLIEIPGFCSAVAFGGPDGNILFVASEQKLYCLEMRVQGGRWHRPAKTQPKRSASEQQPVATVPKR